MSHKSKILYPVSLLAMAVSAQAALTFNIDGIGSTATATPSAGAISGTDFDGVVNASVSTNPFTAGGADTTLDLQNSGFFTISLTSLTLDGVGVDDDSATLVFSVSSAGGTIDDNGTDFGIDGNGAGRISDVSESLTFSFVSASSSVSLGAGATETGVITFLGFNEIDFTQFVNADGDIASIAFGAGSASNVITDPFAFTANPDDMTVGYVAGSDPNDGFKLNNFRARFELSTVPEPSSYALISGLLALSCIMTRRRR